MMPLAWQDAMLGQIRGELPSTQEISEALLLNMSEPRINGLIGETGTGISI
jgi:hypothetical protein